MPRLPETPVRETPVRETPGREASGGSGPRRRVAAVLFDRDGTLVHDVPYNGDPALVVPVPTARAAVAAVRAAGLRLGIVTNQRGIALGLLSRSQVDAVNARVATLLGPFDGVAVCPHDATDRCGCRKPQPGMVLELAARWGVDPAECVVIGDTAADVGAAEASGGFGVLVPNAATAIPEVASARLVAHDVLGAVHLVLDRTTVTG